MPLQTCFLSFVSSGSDSFDCECGSGHRFFGFFGAPPSWSGMKWFSQAPAAILTPATSRPWPLSRNSILELPPTSQSSHQRRREFVALGDWCGLEGTSWRMPDIRACACNGIRSRNCEKRRFKALLAVGLLSGGVAAPVVAEELEGDNGRSARAKALTLKRRVRPDQGSSSCHSSRRASSASKAPTLPLI